MTPSLRYIKVSEAALIAGVSVSTIYRLMDIGVLHFIQPTPTSKRILEASLAEYIRNRVDPDFWSEDLKSKLKSRKR